MNEYNVKAAPYNAVGDGVTDDTWAIQAAIDACANVGGGTVFLPNGTYKISYQNAASLAGCLWLKGGVTLRGESKVASVLKLANSQVSATRPIVTTDLHDVACENFTINGNKANQSVQEHRAGIFVWNTQRVRIKDMIIRDNTGDAIDLYGAAQDVTVERVYAYGNARKAISCNGTGGMNRVSVRDCTFTTNAGQLHVEADVSAVVNNLSIERSLLDEPSGGGYALSFGGITKGAYVSGCTIRGGVNVTSAERVRFEQCYIEAGTQASGPCPVSVSFDAKDITFQDCHINQTANQGSQDNVIRIQAATASSAQRPRRILFADCVIETVYTLAAGANLISVEDVTFDGCRFYGPAGSGRYALQISSADTFTPSIGSVNVRNGYASAMYGGIQVSGPVGGTFRELTVDGFTSEGATVGLDLNSDGRNVLQNCSVHNVNPIGVTTANAIKSWPSVPVLIGGTRGAGGTYSCNGTPEGVITEVVGAMALRRNGAANTTLYVKTSGTGNTGWTAK